MLNRAKHFQPQLCIQKHEEKSSRRISSEATFTMFLITLEDAFPLI
jgi:hypothetical protein